MYSSFMQGDTHAAIAVALATGIPGVAKGAAAGQFGPLLAAVVCAILPDLLERLRRSASLPDLTVVPDPLAPDARILAEAIATAAQQAHALGTSRRVRILPLPPCADSAAASPWVRLNTAEKQAEAGMNGEDGTPDAAFPLPPLQPCWPDRFSLSSTEGLQLTFHPGSTRKQPLDCTARERGWPHSAVFALTLCGVVAVLQDTTWALAAACGIGSHLALDHAGLQGIPWSLPFRTPVSRIGWRLWRGMSPAANAVAVWTAGLIACWNLARATDYLPWRPSLPLLLMLCMMAVLAARVPRGVRADRLPQSGRRRRK